MGANFVLLEQIKGLRLLRNVKVPYLVMGVLSKARNWYISQCD
jgi:hypothetical protein